MLTAFTFRTNNLHWLKSEPGYTTLMLNLVGYVWSQRQRRLIKQFDKREIL